MAGYRSGYELMTVEGQSWEAKASELVLALYGPYCEMGSNAFESTEDMRSFLVSAVDLGSAALAGLNWALTHPHEDYNTEVQLGRLCSSFAQAMNSLAAAFLSVLDRIENKGHPISLDRASAGALAALDQAMAAVADSLRQLPADVKGDTFGAVPVTPETRGSEDDS